MQIPVTQTFFTHYAQDCLSAVEVAAMREWLAQPANQTQAQQWMRQHWDALVAEPARPDPDTPDYESLLNALHQRLDFGRPPYLPLQPRPSGGAGQPRRQRWARWRAAAGSCILSAPWPPWR